MFYLRLFGRFDDVNVVSGAVFYGSAVIAGNQQELIYPLKRTDERFKVRVISDSQRDSLVFQALAFGGISNQGGNVPRLDAFLQ